MTLGSLIWPPTVGLDVGSGAVKAVALHRRRGGWSLTAAGEALLPESDDGVDGTDPTVVSETVSGLLDSMDLRRARVAAGLAGRAVIVKRLALPQMSEAELDRAISWEAEQHIPFDLGDVQLDYQVVTTPTRGTENSTEVLLVAAKRDRIEDRAAVVAQAGRKPVVLDIEAFALANAYAMNHPDRADRLSVLVHVGRSQTIVCVLVWGAPVLTRDISIGGQTHLDALLREFGENGLDARSARCMLHGERPAHLGSAQVDGVLRQASQQVVLEVRNTLDFHRVTAPTESETLSRVVVSGGACRALGLIDLLAADLGAPAEIFDPFHRVSRERRAAGAGATGPSCAVAVGLAMRRASDR